MVLLYALIPVAWIMSLSLKTGPRRSATGSSCPGFSTSTTTRSSSRTDFFNAALVNSLGIAAIATLISIVLAAMAAYALARLDFAGKAVILSGALAVAMFPPISIVGSLFDMWRTIGLFDTWLGLIIPYMTFTLPLAIYTLSAFFREIPWELEQAAQVDGATPFQAFRKVIVPLAAPGVFTAAILVFIFAWNDFLFANTLTSTDERPHRAGGARVLHRRVAVRGADRRHLRRGRGGHDPHHHHGPDLPAPHRGRAHRRRRQGLNRKEPEWPTSFSTTSPSGTPTASRP